ncbi:MAG: hypothetical protein ABIJ97_13905, partial [Bacteroidota bacterium]
MLHLLKILIVPAIFMILFPIYIEAQTWTTLDDFTDGNYTASPVWTVKAGTWQIAAGQLQNTATTSRISTPFITACDAWQFDMDLEVTGGAYIRYFFIMTSDNSDPGNAAADGYYVYFDGPNGDFLLRRLDNGSPTTLITYNGTATTSLVTVKVTRSCNDQFELFTGGISRGTATDATYASSASAYQGVWNTASFASDNHGVDNIQYEVASPVITTLGSTEGCTGTTITINGCYLSGATSVTIGGTAVTAILTNTATQITATIGAGTTGTVSVTTPLGIATSASTFIVNTAAPAVSSLYSPANGATSEGVTGNLIWYTTSSATSYDVYFGTTNPPAFIGNQTINSYDYSGAYNTTYYWRIDTKNACGTTTGTVWSFTTSINPMFSNTTATACGTNFGNAFPSLQQRTITTTGLPAGGLSTSGWVLQQVNVKLGNTSCEKYLDTYQIKLTNPQGVSIMLADPFTTTSTYVMWVDIKFRDDVSLERINEYSVGVQGQYWPFSIGYYAIATDGEFANFNTASDPNGNWLLDIIENETAGDEISFERVDLIFGPPIAISDVTGSTANNDCSGSECIDGRMVIRGTNNTYSQTDPNYPGNIISGCDWNAANNNSAWFDFSASATSAKITISGLNSGASSDIQAIVVQAPDICAVPTIVPNGGCPDDQPTNNAAYIAPNGYNTSDDVYNNGITANMEFNLNGLTIGQKYYLYVDGNAAANASFYIEVIGGCVPCILQTLPIELLSFTASCISGVVKCNWATASELNNDYFTIEKSMDATVFEQVGTMQGADNSNTTLYYEFIDNLSYNWEGAGRWAYYRLKQTDYDGTYKYSDVVSVNCEEIVFVTREEFVGVTSQDNQGYITIL